MAVYKTEDGMAFPAEAYAYVPDPQSPSTWKLRLWEDTEKKETPRQVGMAVAAFSPGGFRGNRVQIPPADVAKVKARIRAAWRRVNPDRDPDEMPDYIKEAESVSQEINDWFKLEEATIGEADVMTVKHIQPGWGATGYYSEELLREHAGKFQPGTLMFWDHPTRTEERERPERSLRDVAAVTISEGRYLEDGPAGPGIYSDVKVMPQYREAIKALAPHIGLSVYGKGKGRRGEAKGKKGMLIEAIADGVRTDFVTMPGAGGEIVQLWESFRSGSGEKEEERCEELTLLELKRQHPELVEELRAEIKEAVYGDLERKKEEKRMTEERIKELEEKLQEAETERARASEALLLREARDFVAESLKDKDIPELTRERLREALEREPVIKDGQLDLEAYKEKIEEAVKAEVEYLARLTESGKVRNMGSKPEESEAVSLKETFKRGYLMRGYPEEEADRLAEIAARGR